MDNPEKPKLKVTDRRQFTREGVRREEAIANGEQRPARSAPAGADARSVGGEARRAGPEHAALERDQAPLGIDISQLVLSLSRQALLHLGEEHDPAMSRAEPDLEAARETIDILMLLQRKTQGNLTREEDSLLAQMIYELQMQYAQKTKS